MRDLPFLKLSNFSQPLSASDLSAIEKSLGYALPEDYKTFIIAQNGGVPDDELVFDFFDEATGSENASAIRRFSLLIPKVMKLYRRARFKPATTF